MNNKKITAKKNMLLSPFSLSGNETRRVEWSRRVLFFGLILIKKFLRIDPSTSPIAGAQGSRSGRTEGNHFFNIFCLLSMLMVVSPLHSARWFGYDRAISAAQRGDWEMAKQSLKDVLIDSPD